MSHIERDRGRGAACSAVGRAAPTLLCLLGVVAYSAAGGGSEPAAAQAPGSASAERSGDRVILITGSTSGLGREVALRLGASGAHVIVHGRDRERGMEVVEEIESGPGSASFYRADFGDFDEVRALADSVRRHHDRLDVLVNNAGIYLNPQGRVLSSEGHELRFQVNHLAHFLLTRQLLPLLEESAPARVVNISSIAASPIDFDNVMLEDGFSESRAYGQSKLAQAMFSLELAERLEGTGVTSNALHPATLMDTPMVEEAGVQPRSSVEDGVEAVLQLVNDDVGSGYFFNGTSRSRAHDQAYDEDVRERLWELSEELTGQR